MAESAGNLGSLEWVITASDADLDIVFDRAYAKALQWAAKMQQITKVPLTFSDETVARPGGGPDRPAQTLPRPADSGDIGARTTATGTIQLSSDTQRIAASSQRLAQAIGQEASAHLDSARAVEGRKREVLEQAQRAKSRQVVPPAESPELLLRPLYAERQTQRQAVESLPAIRELRDMFAQTRRRIEGLGSPVAEDVSSPRQQGDPSYRYARRFAQYFVGVSAAREIGEAIISASSLSDPGQNSSEAAKLQTARRVLERSGTGFIGSTLESISAVSDSMSQFLGSNRRSIFTATRRAIDDAETSLNIERGQSESRIGGFRERRQIQREIRGNGAIGISDPFELARFNIRETYRASSDEMRVRGQELSEKLQQAKATGNYEQVRILSAEIDQFRKLQPLRNQRDEERVRLGLAEVSRREEVERDSFRRRLPGLRSRAELQYGVAEQRDFEAGQQEALARAPESIRPVIRIVQAAESAVRAVEINEDIRRRQATIESARLRLNRRPLEAEIADINEAERQALQNARYGSFDIPGFGRFDYDERPGIRERFDIERRQTAQDRADAERNLDIQIQGHTESVRARLARNPIGAQAAEISAQGRAQADSLLTQGFGKQAFQTLGNAILAEQLLRQNYIDSFRGTAFDTRLFAISPRDGQDPADALKSIDEKIARLLDAVAALVSN